ncbi:hypothetical protein Salat_0887500 [Sesamum alatum]|uniref:Uncharacterized protein n=1 Tax=Sesamum alatum TaxID=300844 RepID=A0AAE2CR80_9LAMI|nr:hypothetical protein Salat_0887500 [Sesamum alatum]
MILRAQNDCDERKSRTVVDCRPELQRRWLMEQKTRVDLERWLAVDGRVPAWDVGWRHARQLQVDRLVKVQWAVRVAGDAPELFFGEWTAAARQLRSRTLME